MTRQKFDRMIYFRVEPSLKEAIFRESDEKRIPASVLLREAVQMGLAEDREKFEKTKDEISKIVEKEGVIWFNSVGGLEFCAICGQYYSTRLGFEVFLNGTKKPICERCTEGTTIRKGVDLLREHDDEFWREIMGEVSDEEKGEVDV